MALFAVTTFVIFRFGLDRTQLSGSLAAGVLWATLLFAAMLGDQPPLRRRARGGRLRRDPAGPDRPQRPLRRQGGGAVVYLVVLELIAVPIFALFFLDSAAALAPLVAVLLLADLGLAATGTLISSMAVNSRARDLLGPARPAAAGRAADDRRHRRHRAAARRWAVPVTTASAPGWRCSAYTI